MYPDSENVKLIKLYFKRRGIKDTYSENKFLSHLHQRMQKNKCSTYKEYLTQLKDEEELECFKNSFSINVTSFFRDPPVFDTFLKLLKIYVKEIIDHKNQSKIRIWSAGCVNGSEPYSIVIFIHQALQHHISRYNIKIHATDIDNDILKKVNQEFIQIQ
ncbi:MAG: CheR family methyltransferase [Candidatus Hodarchaeota archaeon]